jgi:hypothetical protein
MPEHRPAQDEPGRGILAVIQRIKAEIVSYPDPQTLNEIRAAFKREIPLHLRSYAAALLILETSKGVAPRKGDGRRDEGKNRKDGPRKAQEGKRSDGRRDAAAANGEKAARSAEARIEEERPRFEGEGATVFFGMGKRQRLYPRVLLRILAEQGGLSFEQIGDIRSFDNYSFADIDPACADRLISTLDGTPFRGRGLPVSKARKRGAAEDQPREAGPARVPSETGDETGAGLMDETGAEGEWTDNDEGLPDENSSESGDLGLYDEGLEEGLEEDLEEAPEGKNPGDEENRP